MVLLREGVDMTLLGEGMDMPLLGEGVDMPLLGEGVHMALLGEGVHMIPQREAVDMVLVLQSEREVTFKNMDKCKEGKIIPLPFLFTIIAIINYRK